MRLLVDESCRRSLVDALREAGHDVVWVTDSVPSTKDRPIAAMATADERLIITEDYDFGEIAVRYAECPHGVLLIDATRTPRDTKVARVLGILTEYGDQLSGQLVIVLGSKLRWRAL